MKEIENREENDNVFIPFNKVRIVLIILFIFTILSLWLGLATTMILSRLAKSPDYLFTSHMWGMWLWLPLPILSIILGFKYKRKGIRCTKNIVVGFIVGPLLLLYGMFTFFFDFKVDCSELEKYKQVIGQNIQFEGSCSKQQWDQSYLQEHITSYLQFTNAEEIKEFETYIKNSDNWISKEDISSHLGIFVPISLSCYTNDTCYYSIYIKDIDSYNTVPSESGKYHVYSMMYSNKNAILKIEEFVMDYKN